MPWSSGRRRTAAARRAAAVVATVVALATIGSTATPASGTTAARTPTVVRHVSPVDADGVLRPGYDVDHRYGGARCQRGSTSTGTAYRCFTSQAPDNVYDPCWVTSTSDFVVCLEAPWKHKVVRLRVSDGYDDADGFSRQPRPWGLRITGDRHCLLVPAAVQFAQGEPIHYGCNRHTSLAGRLDRSPNRWRMHAYRNTTPHGVQPTYRSLGWVRISVAWRAEPSRAD